LQQLPLDDHLPLFSTDNNMSASNPESIHSRSISKLAACQQGAVDQVVPRIKVTFTLPFHSTGWGTRKAHVEAFRGPVAPIEGYHQEAGMTSELVLPGDHSLVHVLTGQGFSHIWRVDVVFMMHQLDRTAADADVGSALQLLMPLVFQEWCEFSFELMPEPTTPRADSDEVKNLQTIVDTFRSLTMQQFSRDLRIKTGSKEVWRVNGEQLLYSIAPR